MAQELRVHNENEEEFEIVEHSKDEELIIKQELKEIGFNTEMFYHTLSSFSETQRNCKEFIQQSLEDMFNLKHNEDALDQILA